MSESPSDSAPGDLDDDAQIYPIEGKFRSDKDKADIMSMTEIEREEILAERAEEVRRKTQDLQLKRLLQARKREEAQGDKKKRKAGAADLEDRDRKSSRQKVVKASAPLEAYKRQRELKGQQRARAADRRRDNRSSSQSNAQSDRDAEGESEVEWDEGKKKQLSPKRDEPPPDLKAFDRARVGRTNFSRYCHDPPFEAAIKGCFVRVSTGLDASTGRNTYRMIQIKGFKEGRPYAMEGPQGANGPKVYTDRYVFTTIGKHEKDWQFIACSDSKFTEPEFDQYKASLTEDNQRLPTTRFLDQKCADITALIDHRWTDPEIELKMQARKSMEKKFHSYGRDRIIRRREEALAKGDEVYVARLDQELIQYDIGAAAKAATKLATPNKALVQQDRLAALNKANRKANSEEIRRVQIAEKRQVQKSREAAMARAKKAEADAAEAAEAAKNKLLGIPGKTDDLFGDASDVSRAGTPALAKGLSRAGTPMKEKKLGHFRKKNMEDDAIAAMDLGIEIDI